MKLAYAITANKSQGQTLKRVGIYSPTDFFSHGQLYVALSRATNLEDLRIVGKETKLNNCTVITIKNTVFRNIFN